MINQGAGREWTSCSRGGPLVERALGIMQNQLGADHPDVLRTQRILAGMLFDLGDPARAEQLLRQQVARRIATAAEDSPAVATDLHLLGTALQAAGRLDEAETAMRNALARRLAATPVESLALASSKVGRAPCWSRMPFRGDRTGGPDPGSYGRRGNRRGIDSPGRPASS